MRLLLGLKLERQRGNTIEVIPRVLEGKILGRVGEGEEGGARKGIENDGDLEALSRVVAMALFL